MLTSNTTTHRLPSLLMRNSAKVQLVGVCGKRFYQGVNVTLKISLIEPRTGSWNKIATGRELIAELPYSQCELGRRVKIRLENIMI